MAFPLAAFVTGWLAERGFDRRYRTSILAMAAGLSIIFLGGVAVARQRRRPHGGAGHRPLSLHHRRRDQDRRRGPGAAERLEVARRRGRLS